MQIRINNKFIEWVTNMKQLTVFLFFLLFVSSIASAEQAQTLPASDSSGPGFRQIISNAKSKVFPAVTFLKVLKESYRSGKKITEEVAGSGVIISPDGQVLTNWHVIDKAVDIRCLLFDGRPMDAELSGSDKDTDLGLVQLKLPKNSKPLPWAKFSDSSKLKEGDFVMAMGAPWGLSRSVSQGIVSCTRRFLEGHSQYSLWIQTDAAISPGNSGGPLVDTDGKIIGINTRAVMYGGDMGFAIPSRTAEIVVGQLRKYGKMNWSWTGLQLQPLKDFNRNIYFEGTEGIIVSETDVESPARRAGIKVRDRILKINSVPIAAQWQEDLPMVHRTLGLLDKNKPAKFEILRNGKVLTIEVTPRAKGKVEGEELELTRWDMTIKTINQFDNEDLHFYRKRGVFVYGVKSPGNASSAGLSRQDIILKIDNKPIETLKDVSNIHAEAIKKIKAKHRILFTILRSGLMRQIVLDFSRDYEKE